MPENDLREALEALRAEIRGLDPEDADAKARLDALVSDLERRLEAPGTTEEHETLVDSVREAIEQLEMEYPRATSILNHVMVTLSNMGI